MCKHTRTYYACDDIQLSPSLTTASIGYFVPVQRQVDCFASPVASVSTRITRTSHLMTSCDVVAALGLTLKGANNTQSLSQWQSTRSNAAAALEAQYVIVNTFQLWRHHRRCSIPTSFISISLFSVPHYRQHSCI